ncbi:MAG: hypothetical protein PF487_07180 [Bacteroidales bacterium]|jgi:hypothetical protein|nr:hypothetical protein [Bacteroidales bacterium]
MEVRSIKNVDSETWKKFKLLAAKEGVSMASLLKNMIVGYQKKKSDVWGMVFENSGKLSDKEADDIEKITKDLRKEYGFRI